MVVFESSSEENKIILSDFLHQWTDGLRAAKELWYKPYGPKKQTFADGKNFRTLQDSIQICNSTECERSRLHFTTRRYQMNQNNELVDGTCV